jgi:hypothetical protein
LKVGSVLIEVTFGGDDRLWKIFADEDGAPKSRTWRWALALTMATVVVCGRRWIPSPRGGEYRLWALAPVVVSEVDHPKFVFYAVARRMVRP